MFPKLLVALTLAAASGSSAAVLSPVTVIDYASAGRFAQSAQGQQAFRAFKEFNEIIYDRYLDRPWGDAYYSEADARWKTLRASLCPGLEGICQVKEELVTPQHWLNLVLTFKNSVVQDELRSHFANPVGNEPALHVNFGELPQQTDARHQFPVHNVIVSGSEVLSMANYSGIGFFKRGIEVRETEYQYVSDLTSYKQSLGKEVGSVYFLVGAKGPILLVDRMKSKAEEFAARWKFLVEQQADAPADQLFHLDAFVARTLTARWKDAFARKHVELRASLEALAVFEDDVAKKLTGSATEALLRFDREWLEFHWPEEVYQHVAYEFFRGMNGELGLYHFAAGTERVGLNFKRRAWESLLDLQSKFDAQAVLYFLSLESFFPSNVILDQLVDPDLEVRASQLGKRLRDELLAR